MADWSAAGSCGNAWSVKGFVFILTQCTDQLVLETSTPPQNRELDILISNFKQYVYNFVAELTLRLMKKYIL